MTKNEKEKRIDELEKELTEIKAAEVESEKPFDLENIDGQEAHYYVPYLTSVTLKPDEIWYTKYIKKYVPCKNKAIVEKRQERHHLSDLLERFAYENNAVVTEEFFKSMNYTYVIVRDVENNTFLVDINSSFHMELNTIYFTSEEVAERAIKEVVMPFMENNGGIL